MSERATAFYHLFRLIRDLRRSKTDFLIVMIIVYEF